MFLDEAINVTLSGLVYTSSFQYLSSNTGTVFWEVSDLFVNWRSDGGEGQCTAATLSSHRKSYYITC